MKAINKYRKKALMWHKVKEKWLNGLNKSQISHELGIHRKTVRQYLQMNEDEFYAWLAKRRHGPLKLQSYHEFVRKQLESKPYLSSAQIEDRLKEHHADFPSVHSKTVYNFVQSIRSQYQIDKPAQENMREYQKREECAYGYEGQVDFGVYNMLKEDGVRQKVWVFAMVLSRSRQKFVYLQTNPFTTSTAIYAHQLAFEYFQGVPKKILYDQDRVFMVDENLGDLLLTNEFRHYVRNESFESVFCRKADPETKGKVENVVKYVKQNFLRGREFTNIEGLNQLALSWLQRTGNGKRHSTTRLIPFEEWLVEKAHLLPIRSQLKEPETYRFKEYHVLKDHTISYKGNFYSLPLGTYKGKNTKVLVSNQDEKLKIYTLEKQHLTTHAISILKGKYIRHNDHARDKSSGIKERIGLVIERLGNSDKARVFIEKIQTEKPRYLNDNLRLILAKTADCNSEAVEQALDYCLENGFYNANQLTELIAYYQKEKEALPEIKTPSTDVPSQAHIIPATSKIDTYEQVLN